MSPRARRCGAVSEVTRAQPAAAPWKTLLGTTRSAFSPGRRCPGRRRGRRRAPAGRRGDPVDPRRRRSRRRPPRAGAREVLAAADHGHAARAGSSPQQRERPADDRRALQRRVEPVEDDPHRASSSGRRCGAGAEPGGRDADRHDDAVGAARGRAAAAGAPRCRRRRGRWRAPRLRRAGQQALLEPAGAAVARGVGGEDQHVVHDRRRRGTAAGPAGRRSGRGSRRARRRAAPPGARRARAPTRPRASSASRRGRRHGCCSRRTRAAVSSRSGSLHSSTSAPCRRSPSSRTATRGCASAS